MRESPVVLFAKKISHHLYRMLSLDESISMFTCKDAFNQIRDMQADISIIDCDFDIEMGLQILKAIKEKNASTIVILITKTSSEESAIKAFRLGVREYINYPIDIIELQTMINNLLRIKKRTKEKRSLYTPHENLEIKLRNEFFEFCKSFNLIKAIIYINENLSEKIQLDDCANAANLSKFHFCRIFKQQIGTSPMEYVKNLRIEQAKKLLMDEKLSVIEVGLTVGFDSYNGFFRNFKKATGFSPIEFKKSQRLN